jgi:hypothetical protein
MGLKGYRLWVMGQLDSTCTAQPCPPALLYVFVLVPRCVRDAVYGAVVGRCTLESS